jgi:hypothetical protein
MYWTPMLKDVQKIGACCILAYDVQKINLLTSFDLKSAMNLAGRKIFCRNLKWGSIEVLSAAWNRNRLA